MERLDIHRQFLQLLFSLRSSGRIRQVRLVARLYEDTLLGGSSTTEAYVFLPDLHLMSPTAQGRYRYGFDQLERNRPVPRSAIFNAFTRRLADLREELAAEVNVVTIGLGDTVDLWREDTGDVEDVGALTRQILDAFPEIDERLVAFSPESLRAKLLIGNHELFGKAGGWHAAAFKRAKRSHLVQVGSRKSILVTHGDLFDALEVTLPDRVQAYFVREFGPNVKGGACKPDRQDQARKATANSQPQGGPPVVLANPQSAEILADWVNVWVTNQRAKAAERRTSHSYLPNTLAAAGQLRAGHPQTLQAFGLDPADPPADLRAVVIGHSHHPRLSVHRDALTPANNLVLIDCGAWIGSSAFRGEKSPVPSCHLGFLCGGDVRIYQLDP